MKAKRALFALGALVGGVVLARGVNGLSYQAAVDVQFNLNQTLGISLSGGDLRIEDLTPGVVGESEPITITVNTNNATGYKLTAVAGNANNQTSDLINNAGGVFTSIDGSVDSFTQGGTWGVTTNDGESFFGLPAYGLAGSLIKKTTAPSDSSTTHFAIGAKGGEGQPMGEYSNVIQFTVVANQGLTYIQNMDPSQCTDAIQMAYDSRDGEGYYIQRLADGNCWMLDNLRLDLTNQSVLGNVDATNTNADEASIISLKSGNRDAGIQYATSGMTAWGSVNVNNIPSALATYKDDVVTKYGSGSGKVGVYYNYCAATAGSYCYSGEQSGHWNAEYSLCPAGWVMPTGDSNGDYGALYNQFTGTTAEKNIAFREALSISLSGMVRNSGTTPSDLDAQALYWGADVKTNQGAYQYMPQGLTYIASSNTTFFGWAASKSHGLTLRCVLK